MSVTQTTRPEVLCSPSSTATTETIIAALYQEAIALEGRAIALKAHEAARRIRARGEAAA
jgi:hypothetical protein